jgi:hypothetical protein
VKHPEEAKNCLESSKHSGLYKAKRAIAQAAESGDHHMWEELGISAGLLRGSGLSSAEIARQLVLFCAYDLHPWWVINEPGCRLLLVGMRQHSSPLGGSLNFTGPMFDSVLQQEHSNAKAAIKAELKRQRSFISLGPCCSVQLDTWASKATSSVYFVMSVTFVNSNFKWRRLGLSVKAFPSDYTPESIQSWVCDTTAEFFGAEVAPSSAYLICTVGGGQHTLRAAAAKLGIPSLMCSIHSLEKIVKDGLCGGGSKGGPNVVAFTEKILQVLSPLLEPPPKDVPAENNDDADADAELHQTLQKALAPSMLDATREKNLTTVLSLFQRVLLSKSQIEKFCASHAARRIPASSGRSNNAAAAALGLTQKDWSTLQDGIGVLEACAEVDNGMRSAQVVPLAACASLLLELQQYLSEELVYVPELSADPDLHRLEKPACDLQESVQVLRTIIADRLKVESSAGRIQSREEVLATLLNPCHKDDLEHLADDVDADEAWAELTGVFRSMAGALSQPSSDATSTGDVVAKGDQNKRQLKGSMTERKTRRTSDSAGPSSAAVTATHQRVDVRELDRYRALPSLDGDQFNSLAWWSEQASAGVTSESRHPTAPKAVLPYVAAQYYSIDPSSIQAANLFDRVDYRMAGLQATELPHKLQMMLFLRCNRDALQ